MTEAPKEIGKITDYHAHIYYDPADADSRARAAQLREWVEARFPVRMGRWHDALVGPHPRRFTRLLPARGVPHAGAVHHAEPHGADGAARPESGRPRDDHELHAVWMGEVLPVKTEVLPETDA